MRDYINIGSTPASEHCVQTGAPDYLSISRAECLAFKNQLEREFPNGNFGIRRFPHDFGSYFEVVAYFDDEDVDPAEREAAFDAEDSASEVWSPEAKAELSTILARLGYQIVNGKYVKGA